MEEQVQRLVEKLQGELGFPSYSMTKVDNIAQPKSPKQIDY
jgi:hypothetical protein